MSPLYTRTLFASASIALTLVMVSASAPATAAVDHGDVRRMVVRIDDLNLGSAAGRQTLARRLGSAADAVCPTNDTGHRFAALECRATAMAQARADVARVTQGTAS